MSGAFVFGAGPVIRGRNQQEDFYVTQVEAPLQNGPVITNPTDKDVVTVTSTSSTTDNNFTLAVSGGTPVFSSLTPAICSVDANGHVSRITDGVGKVSVKVRGIGTRVYERLFSRKLVAEASVAFGGYVAGSLGADIMANMLALVSGKTPGDSTTLLYTRNNYYTNSGSANYNGDGAGQPNNAVRNASSIAAGLDMSGLSVGTSYGGFFPCCLISPRHVIMADHVSGQGRVAFLGTDGNYYYANIVAKQAISNPVGTNTDICVGYLDTAINAAVKPFKVFPATFLSQLPSGTKYQSLPVLSKGMAAGDKWRIHASIFESYWVQAFGITESKDWAPHSDPNLAPWFSPIIGGDSSGPSFAVVTQSGVKTPVLLSSYHYVQGGAHYGSNIAAIEAAMTALAGSAYTLGKVDLSAFTNFSGGSSISAPVAVGETASTPYNTAWSGNVLANDTDPQSLTLSVASYTIAGMSGNQTLGSNVTISGVGTINIASNGATTFTPTSTYSGAVPAISYTVSNGTLTSSANLSLTVNAQASAAAPTKVQIVLQGQDSQGQSNGALPQNANHLTVAWKSVAGATSYKIYRSVDKGAYALYATVAAADSATAYGSYVSNSGSIDHATDVDCAYQDTTATNCVGSYGVQVHNGELRPPGVSGVYHAPDANGVFFMPNVGYTYKVSAVVGGVESAQSTDSIAVFFAGGKKIFNHQNGYFNGAIAYADAGAIGASPLGNTTNAKWTTSDTNSYINPFAGGGAVDGNISLKGFNYLVLNIQAAQDGSWFTFIPEMAGDTLIYGPSSDPFKTLWSGDYGTLLKDQWVQIKIPLADFMVDNFSGSGARQYSFNKITMDTHKANETYWIEAYFSV